MQFLSVGSHLCARASFRQTLAGLPLPSASGYNCHMDSFKYSHRGLSPHQFMPMSGVHKQIKLTLKPAQLIKSLGFYRYMRGGD